MEESILKSRRNSLVGLLIVATFGQGWLSVFPTQEWMWSLLSLSSGLAATALVITISQMDARPLLRSYHWMIYLIWPLFLPIYVIRTFRWKGLAIITLGFIAYLALSFAGFYLAYLLYQAG